jgi:NADPH:quinone reductase-like Zn-dependent oxidoreductase
MKAIVQHKYGSPDVLELKEIDKPVVEDDNEVLVRVHATSANPQDWHVMTGLPYLARVMGRPLGFGLRKPLETVRGRDVAGIVEVVGKDVERLQPGDEVFGWGDGAFAEFVSAGENNFVQKPVGLKFEQAAAVPLAAFTALQAIRDQGQIQPGQKVLINGASGGVGTFAVQIAKSFGAEVTGVCSARNVDMVRSIGADHVVDYTQEDFTKGEQRYDLIIDSAVSRSLSDCRRALTPEGTYVLFGDSGGKWAGGFSRTLRTLLLAPFLRQKMRAFTAKPNGEDLQFLKELIDSGKITPIIDRTYPLSEVPEAIRYLEEGHARGKVVITV